MYICVTQVKCLHRELLGSELLLFLVLLLFLISASWVFVLFLSLLPVSVVSFPFPFPFPPFPFPGLFPVVVSFPDLETSLAFDAR